MSNKTLAIVCTIIACLVTLVAVAGPGFARGVRQSDECTKTDPDLWICQLVGD